MTKLKFLFKLELRRWEMLGDSAMLDRNLNEFLDALKKNESVVLESSGEWHAENSCLHFLRKIFMLEESRQISLARSYCSCLDRIEQVPVLFSQQSLPVDQKIDFHAYIEAGEIILSFLEKIGTDKANKEAVSLKRRLIALQYRLEGVNGGLDPEPISGELFQKFEEAAARWKHDQHIFFEKVLTERDLHRLQEASRYPAFIKLILSDLQLQRSFMEWVLRDKICVQPFIEYPALQIKLTHCLMNGRLGRLGGTLLKIKKTILNNDEPEGNEEKIVTLPFEGKDINILDENKVVTFRGNYRLSIKEIFETFQYKTYRVGNLEFFLDGIYNWNVNYHGYWDDDQQDYVMIDLTERDWWKQLPLIEKLTKEEAQMKYGYHLDGKRWSVGAVASRESMSLDLYNNHAYLEVIIPDGKDHYVVFDFGKAATEYPTRAFERVTRVCENMLATVTYPDDNFYYTHRQHACHSFPISEEEGLRFMDSIRHDIIKAREGNFVYQIESENCAEWAQNKLEVQLGNKRVPNLFRLPYLETEPIGVMGNIFAMVRKLPSKIQKDFLMLLHIPFGAKKGRWIIENGVKIWKSMVNHSFWETGHVYLPAFLHKQMEAGSFAFAHAHETLPLNGYQTFKENVLRTISHHENETSTHVVPAPKPTHVINFRHAKGLSVLDSIKEALQIRSSNELILESTKPHKASYGAPEYGKNSKPMPSYSRYFGMIKKYAVSLPGSYHSENTSNYALATY